MLSEREINILFERCLEVTRIANRMLDLSELEATREDVLRLMKNRIDELEQAVAYLRTTFLDSPKTA